VGLLGFPGDLNCVTDPAARQTTYLMLAEVCFQLGFRKKSLSPELGRLDPYQHAAEGRVKREKPCLRMQLRRSVRLSKAWVRTV
jgi:hypothetical protein